MAYQTDQSLEPVSDESLRRGPRSDAGLERASTGDLVSGIARDVRDMAEGYLELAKMNIKGELQLAKRSLIAAAVGGAVVLVGVILLALMAAYGLAQTALPVWGAMGIVGGALVILGVIALAVGGQMAKKVDPVPREVVQDAKEDAEWIKDHA